MKKRRLAFAFLSALFTASILSGCAGGREILEDYQIQLQQNLAEQYQAEEDTPELVEQSCENGEIIIPAEKPCVVPFRVENPFPDQDAFLSLLDRNSDDTIMGFYIKAGETVTTKVPVGEACFMYFTGKHWYGLDGMFGEETKFYEYNYYIAFTEEDINSSEIWEITADSFNQDSKELSLDE